MQFNKYQTPLTEELLNTLPKEVQDQLFEFINTVPFIQNLVSPNRQYAKDRPRDKDGKIIVDITNPHILENMDYFRPAALYYIKHGVYTHLRPNANANSEYGKWIRQEKDRCWNGMIRPSDGEWIPGHLYFYFNYFPIQLTRVKEGTKQANRVVDFPEVWEGIYWRYHYINQGRYGGLYNDFKGANHGAELASRGKGKSYCLASNLAHNFVLGEDEISYKDTTSVVTAAQKEYLTKDGVINKFISGIDFCADHTEFPRSRLKNSLQEMVWKMGYKDTETDVEKGSLNSVIGVTSNDDESKLRGKRSVLVGIEEFGSFPRLLALYNTLLPNVQEGEYVFGYLWLQGTAGDDASDFSGAAEIMYNPQGYNMYAIPNVYDKFNTGKKQFVYFFPGYINRKGCYDKNGVSDVIKALVEILMNRFKVKYNSTDPNTILKTMSEIPITPSEAILKTGFNMFPVVDATNRLAQLDNDEDEINSISVGNLIPDKYNKMTFVLSEDYPIRKFPHKDNKIEGAIEIEIFPEKASDSKIFSDRYIVGTDPYDDDGSDTLSLGACYVLDLWTDKIVARYVGRQMFADDFFEICRKLCLFYNAKMNYENNKKGLFGYFSKMNCIYLLTDTLEYLKDKDMVKENYYGNKSKGTNATLPINNHARLLFRNWLISPVNIIKYVDNQEVVQTIKRIYQIKDRALLEEIISFNNEGNFDRISAMMMLMLLREDKMILYGGEPAKNNTKIEKDYLGNDDFFNNNYQNNQSNISKFIS